MFRREKKVSIRTRIRYSKKLKKLKIFDKCNFNFETLVAGSEDYLTHFYKFAETYEHVYYNCSLPTPCILRRTKNRINSMVYFGEGYGSTACVFKDHLFISPAYEEREYGYIYARNIITGETKKYRWLSSEHTFFLVDNMGHQTPVDVVDRMEIKDDKLIINVERRYGYSVRETESCEVVQRKNKDYQIIVQYDTVAKNFKAEFLDIVDEKSNRK